MTAPSCKNCDRPFPATLPEGMTEYPEECGDCRRRGAAFGRLRGRDRIRLMNMLALGEMSQTDMALEFGISQSAVSQFKIRNATEIQKIKEGIADEFVGMWIADKKNRVSAYQDQVHRAEEALVGEYDPATERVISTALKSVAEELAQLPNRVIVQVNDKRVNYTIDGVDPEDLA